MKFFKPVFSHPFNSDFPGVISVPTFVARIFLQCQNSKHHVNAQIQYINDLPNYANITQKGAMCQLDDKCYNASK